MFPFWDRGSWHYECLTNSPDFSPRAMCKTQGGKGRWLAWGECTSECPSNTVIWRFIKIMTILFQLKFVRPLVSSPSPTKVHSMMGVLHMTMMAHYGVILAMVKRTTVRQPVEVTIYVSCSMLL